MLAPWFLFRLDRLLSVALVALLTHTASRAGAEPAVPPLAEQLARAREKKDQDSVLEICRRELEKPGADVPALLAIICAAQIDLKDFPRANETLDHLSKASPAPAAAALAEMRGDLLHAEGKPLDEVLAAWRTAVTGDPADLPAVEGKIADTLDQAGRWEEAAGAFRAVLHHAPGHAARQARLAVCLLNAGHSAEADKEMAAAVKADADDETVIAAAPTFGRLRPQLPALRKLEARIAAGNPPGANSTDDVSVGANTLESASLDRALLLFQAQAYAGAALDAERAFHATEDTSLAARLLLAQALRQSKGASGESEEGEETGPPEQEKRAVALGVAKTTDAKWFDDTDRFTRLRAADKAPRLNAAVPAARAFTVRATIMLAADQPVLALTEARRAHELNETGHLRLDDPEVVLAVAFLRNNQAAEALLAAKRATDFAPKNPDGWAILGRVEQETRADFAGAAEHLSHALSLREEPLWLRRRETCLRTLGRNAEADRDAQRLGQLSPAS